MSWGKPLLVWIYLFIYLTTELAIRGRIVFYVSFYKQACLYRGVSNRSAFNRAVNMIDLQYSTKYPRNFTRSNANSTT